MTSNAPRLIEDAVTDDIAQLSSQDAATATAATRMVEALKMVKGRSVLFLGAAISTFKPAQLPMWNEFVRLLWSSCSDVAFPTDRQSQTRNMLLGFLDSIKRNVPNHMVTEVIARRLGMEYLDVLEAFQAQRDSEEKWSINHVHAWVARCLSSGTVAAVVTTNFDDYIERALEVLGADTHQVTGEHQVDDKELSQRLDRIDPSRRLVLVINGAKAFAFIRSMMPHLGGGKITFLFKLHGSCYDPPSCIDTRLQRTQGLPSFCTDILDTLLKRAVWLVAGFSGSDMNDNLDYLRFLSNRQHARIFWTSYPGPHQESAVQRLSASLPYESGSHTGLSHMGFWFKGPRTSAADGFALFDKKIADWAARLGQDWCKLILIDLVKLFESRSPSHKADPVLVEQLSGGRELRQDWNPVLDAMNLQHMTHQADTAKSCAILCSELNRVDFNTTAFVSSSSMSEICQNFSTSLADLRALQYNFDSKEMQERTEPLHAQAWVLSATSGLAMLVAGEPTAAITAFERSSTMARLVGHGEVCQLLSAMVAAAYREHQSGRSHDTVPQQKSQPERQWSFATSLIACIPGLDNVSSKMNAAGMPPQVYIRALLHRSILFADSVVVMPNTIANSTVFVDEVLFQGELNELNMTYISHLMLVLPDHIRHQTKKLSTFRRSRKKGYLFEPVDPTHLAQLDAYFDDPAHAHRILYFDETAMGSGYGSHLQGQFHALNRRHTSDHLVQHWQHRGRKASAPAILEREHKHQHQHEYLHTIQHVVHDLIDSVAHLTKLLKGRTPTRSELYKFADLFDEAHDDPRTFLQNFISDLEDADLARALAARERIINRPWMYGPLCHEIFDMPYVANMIFSLQEQLQRRFHIFLEDADTRSWMHTGRIRLSQAGQSIVINPCAGIGTSTSTNTPGAAGQQCSALILGQLSAPTLRQARAELSFARQRIRVGATLSTDEVERIHEIVGRYTSGPERMPEITVTRLVELAESTKSIARELLKHCVFIVRKGRALDPMYEEAQLSIPGLATLTTITAAAESPFHETSYRD